MPITYRDAVPEDFAAIVPGLREVDVEEWRWASGKTPAEHLRDGSWSIPVKSPGVLCRVAVDEHGPVLLYGVDPGGLPGWGWVWAIACNRIRKYRLEAHKAWDREINLLIGAGYTRLWTASWVGNPDHHRWLRWIGFKPLGDPSPSQHGGLFQPFIYGD